MQELTTDDDARADREELKFLTEQAARIRQRLQAQAQQLRVPPIQAAAMLQPELQLQPQCVAAKLQGVQVQVVSMPCIEWFDQQSQAYRDQVLPPRITAFLHMTFRPSANLKSPSPGCISVS